MRTIVEATLEANMPNDAQVGQMFKLTGTAIVYGIDADLVDTGLLGLPQRTPGERRYKVVVYNADFELLAEGDGTARESA